MAEDPRQEQAGEGAELTPEQQQELRRKLDEQLRRVRVQDVLLESVASILNLSARRIVKEDERDLDQARVGIDAVRAVLELLPEEARQQVRTALSELQMLYAREAGGEPAEGVQPAGEAPGEGARKPPPKRDSGLWTPPGSG